MVSSSSPPSTDIRVLLVGSRAMVRAHVHDLLKQFFTVWGAEQLTEAEAWIHADTESEEAPPPVVILLADTLNEGLNQHNKLRELTNDQPFPVLLLVEAQD